MPPEFGQSRKPSRSNVQRSSNPGEQSSEDEQLQTGRKAVLGGQPVSKDVLHRTILQLQRTVGNQATRQIVTQKNAEPAIQRAIVDGPDHKPVLATLFDDAERVVSQLLDQNYLAAYQKDLPAGHAHKTAKFGVVWADAGGRAAVSKLARDGFVGENPDFMDAVTAFKAAPNFDKAIAIIDRFITRNAAEAINVEASVFNAYAAAREKLDTPAPPPVDLQVEDDADFQVPAQGRSRS